MRFERDRNGRIVSETLDGQTIGYDPFGRRVWKIKELTLAQKRLSLRHDAWLWLGARQRA